MNDNAYAKSVKRASPASNSIINVCKAFIVGGAICFIAEALFVLINKTGATQKETGAWVCISLIAVTAALTGLGVFDKLAKHAGAGTMIPITGFANSVVSPAIEFQTEGRITGTAVKMFTIAGPVIVYGCSAASLYGFIYYFFIKV